MAPLTSAGLVSSGSVVNLIIGGTIRGERERDRQKREGGRKGGIRRREGSDKK